MSSAFCCGTKIKFSQRYALALTADLIKRAMAGQLERRSFRNQLVACDRVGDKILFGSAGDINKLAIGAEGDGLDKFAGGDRLGSSIIDARDGGKNTHNFWPEKCMLWK